MVFQLGSALLDACVLSVLSRDDAYGYKLTQEVREVINISESTLYPVLRRLQKDECLETYDMPYQGRNRRYYKITTRGKDVLDVYLDEWKLYSEKINKVFYGGK